MKSQTHIKALMYLIRCQLVKSETEKICKLTYQVPTHFAHRSLIIIISSTQHLTNVVKSKVAQIRKFPWMKRNVYKMCV